MIKPLRIIFSIHLGLILMNPLISHAQIGLAGNVETRIMEKLLQNVHSQNVPGKLTGLLVPSRVDLPGRQIAAFGYALLRKPRFKNVIFLYQAPAREPIGWGSDVTLEDIEETVSSDIEAVMPISNYVETPLGLLPVDQALRQYIMAYGKDFKLDDSAHLNSENAYTQMTFLHYVTQQKKIQVLPIGFQTANLEIAKDIALIILDSLDELEAKKEDYFILISASLSQGLSRARAGAVDSQILTLMEGLSGEPMRSYMEEVILEEAQLSLFNQAAPLLTGILILNQDFASAGYPLMYANTGQFPITKETKSVEGMTSTAFIYGKLPQVKLKKDKTSRIAKKLPVEYLRQLLEQARLAMGHALNPGAQAPQPLLEEEQVKSWADTINIFKGSSWSAFISIYRDGEVKGQSGSLRAQGPLEEAVKYHAVQAAIHDPQRQALKYEDMESITISLAIPVSPKGISTERKIVQSRDGVMLQYRNRKNTFMPNAWKSFPHRHVLLSELASQIGLEPWKWKAHRAKLSVFQALMISEGGR